jgi:hypothetical protein
MMKGMRDFPLVLKSCVAAALMVFPHARAADSVRILVLETAPKDAVAIRKQLGAMEKGKEDVITAVLEKTGVTTIAEFKEENAWRGEPLPLEKKNGELKIGGEVAQELGVSGRFDGVRLNSVPTDVLQIRVALEAGAKACRILEMAGSARVPKKGQWQEMASWGDAESTRMVWSYGDFEEPAQEQDASASPQSKQECMRLEMELFQATDEDIAKLALAKPENRGKALDWLRGRAKLPKECSFWMRPGERAIWMDLLTTVDFEGGKMMMQSNGISVDGGYTGTGDDLKMECKLEATVKGEVAATHSIAEAMKPGELVFIPIKDFPGTTVAACRLSRE